jgi:hypothetical protein
VISYAAKAVSKIVGLDSLITYSLMSKIIQGGGLILALLAVNLNLDEVERGFYFSFISLASLQIFFELGIGVVIVQHTSRLIVACGGSLEPGETDYDSPGFTHVRGIYQFNLIWTIVAGLILFISVFSLGFTFFSAIPEASLISWSSEWTLLVVSVALFLPLSSQLSFFEGAGYLSDVLKLRFFMSLLSYGSVILVLTNGLGLYAVSALYVSQVLLVSCWMLLRKRKILKILLVDFPQYDSFRHWAQQLWSMQWKIAISWICGYLAFQAATPIVLNYLGAVAAGEVGLFLNISNMLVSLIGAWMATKIPVFSALIEQNNFLQLNELFDDTVKKSATAFLFISCCLFAVSTLYLHVVDQKFVTTWTALVFLILSALTSISFAQGVYLRCFLLELFVPSSLAYALIILVLLPFILPTYGLNGLLGVYLVAAIVSVGMTSVIFIKFRKRLHVT